MKPVRVLSLFVLVISFGLLAAAQEDRGYNNGYDAGYQAGRSDARGGQPADFSRSEVYRRGPLGWEPRLGDRDQYRESFRDGFKDGYQDGYKEPGATVPAEPLPPPPPPPPDTSVGSGQATDEAFASGYSDGYAQGRRDRGGNYDASHSEVYRDARRGYDPARFPSMEDYQFTFRQGYEAGYDDAYHGREANPQRQGMRNYSSYGPGPNPYANAPSRISIPEGTMMRLRLNNTLSTRSSRQGDRFTATVNGPVHYPNSNEIAIPVQKKE